MRCVLAAAMLLVNLAFGSIAESEEGVQITPLATNVDASFRGLAMNSPREAWATGTGGTVIQTTDGGLTWKKASPPNSSELDFRDVELLPGGVVILMSAGEAEASRVYRSVDSGKTWRVVLQNKDEKGFFDGIAFSADGSAGLLYGDPIDGRLDVYRTTDGGATWSRLPLSSRPAVKEGEYGFAASGSGIAVRQRHAWIATGGAEARVFRSKDLGDTWRAADSKVRRGTASAGIFSIDFSDASRGVAIGGDYLKPDESDRNLAITTDGGASWSAPKVKMRHKACVKFLSGRVLLACGRTGVAISRDGGRSWRDVTDDDYYVCAFDAKSRTGYLAGKDGRVARLATK